MTPLVRRHAGEDTARREAAVPAALLLLSDVTATAGATQNTPRDAEHPLPGVSVGQGVFIDVEPRRFEPEIVA